MILGTYSARKVVLATYFLDNNALYKSCSIEKVLRVELYNSNKILKDVLSDLVVAIRHRVNNVVAHSLIFTEVYEY